jgi:hypothetical protein
MKTRVKITTKNSKETMNFSFVIDDNDGLSTVLNKLKIVLGELGYVVDGKELVLNDYRDNVSISAMDNYFTGLDMTYDYDSEDARLTTIDNVVTPFPNKNKVT